MVLPPTLMERNVKFLLQVNMTILVLSALMLSSLVSHHFSIVLMLFCVRCQIIGKRLEVSRYIFCGELELIILFTVPQKWRRNVPLGTTPPDPDPLE